MDVCNAVEKQFIDTLGLNTATLGRTGVERIVRAAMKRSGVADAAAYLELLTASTEEFERFMEELVVPETWFFRDREPFVLLKRHLLETWFPAHPDGTVRILSIPCSSGEEPYSIAITLLDAGMQPRQVHLDAADISRSALAAAGRAVYGKGAFRHPLTAGQAAFFTGPSGERRLDEAVVRTVRFHRENLISPCLFAGQAPYDVIFCRNVLIYLTDDARGRAIENIGRLLARDGLLFTGHAEVGILLQKGFTAVRHARAFACRRGGAMQEIGETMPHRVPTSMMPQGLPDGRMTHRLPDPASQMSQLQNPFYSVTPVKTGVQNVLKRLDSGACPGLRSGIRRNDVEGILQLAPISLRRAAREGAAQPPASAAKRNPRSVAPPSPLPQPLMQPPIATEALHAKALALADRGLFDEAATLCRQHLRERPPYADGYCLLGLIHEAARHPGEAEACYLKALYLDPDHYETLIQLSLLYRQQGEERKALLYRQRAEDEERRHDGTVAP